MINHRDLFTWKNDKSHWKLWHLLLLAVGLSNDNYWLWLLNSYIDISNLQWIMITNGYIKKKLVTWTDMKCCLIKTRYIESMACFKFYTLPIPTYTCLLYIHYIYYLKHTLYMIYIYNYISYIQKNIVYIKAYILYIINMLYIIYNKYAIYNIKDILYYILKTKYYILNIKYYIRVKYIIYCIFNIGYIIDICCV